MRGTFACALVAAAALAVAGCGKARTPEAAQQKLCKAVGARDASALFEALDEKTRWAWMTVQKSHREAYDIILSNYPEGAERERELRRFERGAVLGSGRALFAEAFGQAALATLGPFCAGDARFERGPDGENATAVLASGAHAPLRRGSKDTWGFAGFADDAEDRQRRALADVDEVRVSAADYERAATRSAK